jgi:hypothetical protein
VRELCGKTSVKSVTLCCPLCTIPTSHPSTEDGRTLKRGTDAYPALGQDDVVMSGQRGVSSPSPPPCAAIPAAVPPSRAMQRHPWHCGATGRRDITTPAIVRLPALRQHDHRFDVQTTTKREAPTPLPSKPLLDRHMTRRDAPQKQDSPGRSPTARRCTLYRHMSPRTVRHDCKPPPRGL